MFYYIVLQIKRIVFCCKFSKFILLVGKFVQLSTYRFRLMQIFVCFLVTHMNQSAEYKWVTFPDHLIWFVHSFLDSCHPEYFLFCDKNTSVPLIISHFHVREIETMFPGSLIHTHKLMGACIPDILHRSWWNYVHCIYFSIINLYIFIMHHAHSHLSISWSCYLWDFWLSYSRVISYHAFTITDWTCSFLDIKLIIVIMI